MGPLCCLRRHVLMIRTLPVVMSIVVLARCEAAQVANRTINQSSYLPDLQYRQVLDNLAIIADNPAALPYFNPPNTSKTTIQRTAQKSFGLQWGLISALQHVKNLGMMPLSTSVTKMYEPLVLSQVTPGFQGTQQNIDECDTALFLDPIRAIVMQGLYRKVLGYPPSSPFQLRLLQKYFYDYPNEQINDVSTPCPDCLTPPYLVVQEAADHQTSIREPVDAANNVPKIDAPAPAEETFETEAKAPTEARGSADLPNVDPLRAPSSWDLMTPDVVEGIKCEEVWIAHRLMKLRLCDPCQEPAKKGRRMSSVSSNRMLQLFAQSPDSEESRRRCDPGPRQLRQAGPGRAAHP
jgi:hypothetical protein